MPESRCTAARPQREQGVLFIFSLALLAIFWLSFLIIRECADSQLVVEYKGLRYVDTTVLILNNPHALFKDHFRESRSRLAGPIREVGVQLVSRAVSAQPPPREPPLPTITLITTRTL